MQPFWMQKKIRETTTYTVNILVECFGFEMLQSKLGLCLLYINTCCFHPLVYNNYLINVQLYTIYASLTVRLWRSSERTDCEN